MGVGADAGATKGVLGDARAAGDSERGAWPKALLLEKQRLIFFLGANAARKKNFVRADARRKKLTLSCRLAMAPAIVCEKSSIHI